MLSETAGAAKELGEAITINVNNQDEIVEALEEAVAMPEEEQIERIRKMQKRLQRYNVTKWATEFIDGLLYTKNIQRDMEARVLTPRTERKLLRRFQRSRQRLILLDYDGTLIPFSPRPEKAKPGDELIKLLKELTEDSRNKVILISGRDKNTLEKWFGNLNLELVAEHGAWIKETGQEWETIEDLNSNWKEELRPVFEQCVDRTPGSFVEEKEFSLVWHCRKVEPRLGELRTRELVNVLGSLTANLNLQVLEGSKVVEVKNAGINKGRAALQWISKKRWGFILAIGDDWTDEDLFKALPPKAWSIKVGISASAARFNIGSPNRVRRLLRAMIDESKA